MSFKFERKFGEATTLNFNLWETDGVSVNSTASARPSSFLGIDTKESTI